MCNIYTSIITEKLAVVSNFYIVYIYIYYIFYIYFSCTPHTIVLQSFKSNIGSPNAVESKPFCRDIKCPSARGDDETQESEK